MSTSINPTIDNSNPRLDQGATWFRDHRWTDDDGNAIALSNYEIIATVFYKTGGIAFGPYTEGAGITEGVGKGTFEVRIPKEDTAKIRKEVKLVLVIDLKRVNSKDNNLGYDVNEVLRLIAGNLIGYPEHAGK